MAQFIVVANKIDDKENRVISFLEGKSMANDYNTEYFEVSAKDNLRINQVIFFF